MTGIESISNSFSIRDVIIPGRLLLAPMDGFTDSPFRTICKEKGSALCTSEFINGIDVTFGHPYLKYKTYFSSIERPFCYQLFDDDPQRILNSALSLARLEPDLIDINMGCSARNVSNRGAGAGLLKRPDKVKLIASDLVSSLQVPVTAKIRLGWDDKSRNYLEIVQILQDCGISAITVHARTRNQRFSGFADWDAIAEVKSAVSIPVIGNGDARSIPDALRMIDHTACDAVMIGRAALGNPWLFAGTDKNDLPGNELFQVISRHLDLMLDLYSPRIGTVLFRKHMARYLTGLLPTAELRRYLFSIDDPVILKRELIQILTSEEKNEKRFGNLEQGSEFSRDHL